MTTADSVVTQTEAPPTPSRWERTRSHAGATAAQIRDIFRRSPEWAVIIFSWLAAAFVPAFWYVGEDHWWSQPNSPLFFEPFVPLFAAALAWQDRHRLKEAWQMTPRHKRKGLPILLWIGCLVVLVSHLIHVLTVAAIGLVIVAAGIIYMAYGPFVLKQSARPLLFCLLLAPPPVKPLTTVARWFSNSAWTKITAALQRLGQNVSCTVGADSTDLVIQGQVITAPNNQLSAIILSGFLLLFYGLWRRDKPGAVLLTMAFGSLIGGILAMVIPFLALLLPPTFFSGALVKIHPLVVAAVAVSVAVLVRNRMNGWLESLAMRSRIFGKLSAGAQKATDRATAGVTSRLGSGVGRAGQGMTKGTEVIIDKFIAAVSKPFKRKRRNRW